MAHPAALLVGAHVQAWVQPCLAFLSPPSPARVSWYAIMWTHLAIMTMNWITKRLNMGATGSLANLLPNAGR
jgi:hypothetical protein